MPNLPGSALCGLALQIDARGQNASMGAALLQMAGAWLVFYTAYRILAPGGVAELYFRWKAPSKSRRFDPPPGKVVMALVTVVAVAELQPAALADDVLGMPVSNT